MFPAVILLSLTNQVISMSEDLKKLLYTTKDGLWYWETDYASDQLELEEEDIDFERIPEIRKLLKPATNWKELYIPLEAAQVLASWGDDVGLEYLEYVVDLRPDKWGNGEPHRLREYDTTYEWITRAVAAYSSFHYDKTGKDIKRQRICPIMKKILYLSSLMEFEFLYFDTIVRRRYTEYDEELKAYMKSLFKNEDLHHWKVNNVVKFFIEYNPDFLDKTLAELGKSRPDYLDG